MSMPLRMNQKVLHEKHPAFSDRLRIAGSGALHAREISVLQVNLGYQCNMSCSHCHVSAGRGRKESMDVSTAAAVLTVLLNNPIDTLDLTGGAPELNPHFASLVRKARKAGKQVIVRTNLTVFFEPEMDYLPAFYRELGVELIASLPCYLEQNVDAARGRGAYAKSIEALRRLNAQGFGLDSPGSLSLSLVYNPAGAFLPPLQSALEADYKRELKQRHGISFTRLLTFANMPIGRFNEYLKRSGEREKYLHLLASGFNPATLDRIMCRTMLNVGWDGKLYDCDFNQVAGTPVTVPGIMSITDFDYGALSKRTIAVDDHCYGCTAGQGSS